jgi:hypothetical protein
MVVGQSLQSIASRGGLLLATYTEIGGPWNR